MLTKVIEHQLRERVRELVSALFLAASGCDCESEVLPCFGLAVPLPFDSYHIMS